MFTCRHPLLTTFHYVDKSDEHTDIGWSRSRQLSPVEKRMELSAGLFSLEDPATGRGRVWIRLAASAAVRTWDAAPTFVVQRSGDTWQVTAGLSVGANHRVVTLDFTGGGPGRTQALHRWQLEECAGLTDAPARLMSNTWGDRSRADKLSEAFVLAEIDAAADLGVEIVQIDDGWQKGRSKNTVDSGGVWNDFWAHADDYWQPDPVRFPRGLPPLVAHAQTRGLCLGLWYAPDSSNEAANWERDAEMLLSLWRTHGIADFKLDAVKLGSAKTENRFLALLDRLHEASAGAIRIDLDTTAEARLGFWGDLRATIFVQNRYTDWGNSFPHATLRALWSLAHTIHPARLRLEFLNPARNEARYDGDPLRPSAYPPGYLFAVAMLSAPLAWFENTGLSADFIAAVAPLIALWKQHRETLHGGATVPVGDCPNGYQLTGFVVCDTSGHVQHLLAFRERSRAARLRVSLPDASAGDWKRLAGDGKIHAGNASLDVTLPDPQTFGWFHRQPSPSSG